MARLLSAPADECRLIRPGSPAVRQRAAVIAAGVAAVAFAAVAIRSGGGPFLAPRLFQRLQEHVGRLGAGDAVLPVDDEEGDGPDAEGVRFRLVPPHFIGEGAGT